MQGREVDDMMPAHEVSTDVLSLPIPDGFQDFWHRLCIANEWGFAIIEGKGREIVWRFACRRRAPVSIERNDE